MREHFIHSKNGLNQFVFLKTIENVGYIKPIGVMDIDYFWSVQPQEGLVAIMWRVAVE